MKRRTDRCVAIAFLAVACATQVALADDPPVPDLPPTAMEILPKPEDLGPEWYWPWKIPRQYTFAEALGDTNSSPGLTEESWRKQFHKNPKNNLYMQAIQLDSMTDDEFKASMAFLGGLFNMMADTNSAAGMQLTSGGTVGKEIEKIPQTITRTQMVAELQDQVFAIKDWAANDYNRAKPNGKKSETKGYVPHDEDSLTLELTLYKEDYMGSRKLAFDLSEPTLKKTVEERRQSLDMMQKAMENQLEEYAREYEYRMGTVEQAEKSLKEMRERNDSAESIASQEKYVGEKKKEAKEAEDAVNRVVTRHATVKGAMLEGVDGGYLISELTTDCESQNALIYGKLRCGSAVVDVSRTAEGVFAAEALKDTVRALNLLAPRLGSWAKNRGGTAINMDAAKTLKYDYQADVAKVPVKLKEKLPVAGNAANSRPATAAAINTVTQPATNAPTGK